MILYKSKVKATEKLQNGVNMTVAENLSVSTNNESAFVRTDYTNWSTAIFEGFYESNLFNSDTMYYVTYNDRGETEIDENGNEVPILAENEEWDIVGDDWTEFQKDVCEYAVDKLEELATEYKEPNEFILKNFKLHGISSPSYYNFETDKLHIDLDVNVRELEFYCFVKHANDFNNYLADNFTSYDGFCSFIDNNIIDFHKTYMNNSMIDNKRIDTREGNVMIEYYLLTCIYETTDLRSVENRTQDEYRYHFDLIEYADSCVYQYMTKVKI